MKIVSWNLNFGSRRKRSKLDFLKVLDDIGADVLLAQEMFVPTECPPGQIINTDDYCKGKFGAFKYCLFNEIPTNRPKNNWNGSGKITPADEQWGTAILSKEPLKEVELKFSTAYPGTISVAKVNDICLISMYGKLIHWNDTTELYLSNLHRCISDLSTLLPQPFVGKNIREKQGINHFVLAGDWNSSPQFGKFDKNFFERLFLFGLKDCMNNLSFTKENGLTVKGYTKTFFGQQANSDIQDDWFFADDALYGTLKKTAGTYEQINSVSDHFPIVAEF